ncbi:IclR family transcriptional regulator [Achromobacter aloeverae]|uniref:IclR family transcriptional regulator n=1 Tax=Achromobacter aloeverae TaxID=1750518 RepID=A0A4Q1HM12_9BURK|nr:IclR family transcriptional regulator [Achromobacter aloeverae]RXN91230.1 IclR family transcriptional regulator [Achromobacter aloeverae]
MSEVKLVARTLDLFECYANQGEALSLTELSQALAAPMSSTLALVRTLVARGYLYQTRKRTYYPTKKLMGICGAIDAQDPVLDILRPYLARLRDESGETAVLGTREELQVIYLDCAHSLQAIRYTAQAGEARGLHSNSLGKALLSALDGEELEEILAKLDMKALTRHTLTSRKALLKDLALSRERGWSANVSESVPDLAAIAAPFSMAGKWYALSVVGPIGRMQAAWDRHVAVLAKVIQALARDQAIDNI